jgi:short-subunit dehydrogenase
MKIAITGHTKGIGKAIAGLYYTDEVVGFSRSNGYDISKPEDVKSIIKTSIEQDCENDITNLEKENKLLRLKIENIRLHKKLASLNKVNNNK